MKNNKLPSVVILLILTAISTLFWLSFSVYRVFTTEPSPVISDEVMMEIDPSLDVQTMTIMKNKIYP